MMFMCMSLVELLHQVAMGWIPPLEYMLSCYQVPVMPGT
jgi:hypothetical protein